MPNKTMVSYHTRMDHTSLFKKPLFKYYGGLFTAPTSIQCKNVVFFHFSEMNSVLLLLDDNNNVIIGFAKKREYFTFDYCLLSGNDSFESVLVKYKPETIHANDLGQIRRYLRFKPNVKLHFIPGNLKDYLDKLQSGVQSKNKSKSISYADAKKLDSSLTFKDYARIKALENR